MGPGDARRGGIRAFLEPYSDALRQALVDETGALGQNVLQIILSLVVATFFWVSGDALAAAWYSRSLSDDVG